MRSFDLLWTVRTPQRIVTERTPFEEIGPGGYGYWPATSWSIGFGLGPVWWYDPFYSPFYYPFRYPYWSRPLGYRYGVPYRHFSYRP